MIDCCHLLYLSVIIALLFNFKKSKKEILLFTKIFKTMATSTKKQLKIVSMIGLLFMVFSIPSFAQDTLPGVTVISYNYKYLKSINDTNAAQSVKMLQKHSANYDVKSSEFYEEEYDEYIISFNIPKGEILATYDKEGKIIRTAERFKNVSLPPDVRKSVNARFPNWAIAKDFYLVSYYADSKNPSKKMYKLLLENGSKRLRVKTNEKGEFIEK
jgi:hypothetical protein